jgi:hypothetical protein
MSDSTFQQVSYRPIDAKRSRAVILADPVTDGWSITGQPVNENAEPIGEPLRIDNDTIVRRRLMITDPSSKRLVIAPGA